jgi:hypothetical protein
MSAGSKAKPLGQDGWVDKNNAKVTKKRLKTWKFACSCGYNGCLEELLAEDDNDILYCPKCLRAGWVWK